MKIYKYENRANNIRNEGRCKDINKSRNESIRCCNSEFSDVMMRDSDVI